MLSQVLGIVLLDHEGNRLAVKYCTTAPSAGRLQTSSQQTKFEADIIQRASRIPNKSEVAEVLMVDDYIVLVKSLGDINVFVVGDPDENELILSEVLNTVCNSITICVSGPIGKRQIQENLGTIFIILDEVVDQGVIFETDPTVIAGRVQMSEKSVVEAAEQTMFNQALSSAKENLLRNFLSSS